MEEQMIRVGERWVNRFSGKKVTITGYDPGRDVDYMKDNPMYIVELNKSFSHFTKPEHIFLRQYEKIC
jgi:hypothetical protein